eukprot:s157_g43.t1
MPSSLSRGLANWLHLAIGVELVLRCAVDPSGFSPMTQRKRPLCDDTEDEGYYKAELGNCSSSHACPDEEVSSPESPGKGKAKCNHVSPGEEDPDQPLLHFKSIALFDKAVKDWHQRVKEVSADYRTALQVTFTPNISSARCLHDLIGSMGVKILALKKGQPLPADITCPFGIVAGDSTQPAVIVTFKRSPGEQKVTLQANLRQKTVTAKARRGAIEAVIERLLAFLGPVIRISSSAPAVGTQIPAAGGLVNVRDLIIKQKRAA